MVYVTQLWLDLRSVPRDRLDVLQRFVTVDYIGFAPRVARATISWITMLEYSWKTLDQKHPMVFPLTQNFFSHPASQGPAGR